MPRTLLLALIATAMTACNKSAAGDRQVVVAPDNIRKLPVKGDRHAGPGTERVTNEDSAVTH